MSKVEIEIPPGSAYVGVVRLAVSSLARAVGLDEEKVDDLRIAVSEACTNAVLAHEDAGLADPVAVTWVEEPDRLVIEVVDRSASEEPDPDTDSQGFSSRVAMSVALLESLVDECRFLERSGGGTRVQLTVALSSRS